MISKFRAWDIHEKKMFTNDQIIIWNGNIYVNNSSNLNADNLKGWSIDEKYRMQSTGFRDKNGVEVFEDDVVKHSNMKKALVCRYFEERAAFMAMSLDGNHWVNFYDTEKWEIIGNLYENPELLETHAVFGSICENTSDNTGASQ